MQPTNILADSLYVDNPWLRPVVENASADEPPPPYVESNTHVSDDESDTSAASARKKIKKFIRRNKLAITLSVIVLVLLIGILCSVYGWVARKHMSGQKEQAAKTPSADQDWNYYQSFFTEFQWRLEEYTEGRTRQENIEPMVLLYHQLYYRFYLEIPFSDALRCLEMAQIKNPNNRLINFVRTLKKKAYAVIKRGEEFNVYDKFLEGAEITLFSFIAHFDINVSIFNFTNHSRSFQLEVFDLRRSYQILTDNLSRRAPAVYATRFITQLQFERARNVLYLLAELNAVWGDALLRQFLLKC